MRMRMVVYGLCLGMLCSMGVLGADAQWQTPFERSQGTQTATYAEGIAFYQSLAAKFPEISIQQRGLTDAGLPLHLVLYSAERNFDVAANRRLGRSVLLVNNAIHAGEPDGVDASMLLLRDIAQNKYLAKEMRNVLLAIVPFYNIGGVLNRGGAGRANQDGPEEYGFRGSAANYDLNRDFIKTDTLNMRSFAGVFHELDPDVLIDTHVSDGADYQYVMTLDYPQADKLGGSLQQYLQQQLLPALFAGMQRRKFEMSPYVNAVKQSPEEGWVQFMDWPRYSSGYAALFQTLGFMSESHMLKPYAQRVQATRAFIEVMLQQLAQHGKALQVARNADRQAAKEQRMFAVHWEPDMRKFSTLRFKGYESRMLRSEVTTGERLFYDRNKPYRKDVKYYDFFRAACTVSKPDAYVFSQAWSRVVDLLRLNGVVVEQLDADTVLPVEVYYIGGYKTGNQPYEGHYLHSDVEVRKVQQSLLFRKGDFWVRLNQVTNRYLMEVLEPQAPDSFFAWNFFDTILQRKEYFSGYVFEDIAKALLATDTVLQQQYTKKLKTDAEFSASPEQQLTYLYERSQHYEAVHMRYPIFRYGSNLSENPARQ